MKKTLSILVFMLLYISVSAQMMTPEMLWELNRVSVVGITSDGNEVIFSTTKYDIQANSRSSQKFKIPIAGGDAVKIDSYDDIYADPTISADGKYKIKIKEVKLKPVSGTDFYPELEESNVYIYDNLNYRHWDTWEDGEYSHLLLQALVSREADLDIMAGEPYDCPQMPFGGSEDYLWNNDGTKVLYVTKKEYGTEYAKSTNSDIYEYDLASKATTNLTSENKGYDTQPAFSKDGVLAYLQMEEAGYEADKNDLIILKDGVKTNLTKDWDGTVNGYLWSNNGKEIYFNAAISGTIHLFKVNIPKKGNPEVKQITDGQFYVSGIIGQSGNTMVVTRTDMNHATEIYTVELKSGEMKQLSHANDALYAKIKLSKVEKRMTATTDGKEMLSWIIYPPDFDPAKKYPTLLYCQGGPQSALSQFYSYRWNFQLMAANGYIIVAPNRRGMPGYGDEWNEQISGDWGGQNMRDYLSAIDDISKESYVDNDRLGCVGASYGGYSAFYLAGMHENRFKTFIAHDGVFNTRSMYGTTEELFFVNKDFGGAYWENPDSKSYNEFNPIEHVDKWDTPILIIQGGRDYRISIGQGLEAFQAAQLKGIKSKLLYFPEENHWVLNAQNGIIWQNEFFKWLSETID
ncbi:MAG: S9 family peptidase [Bacteroidetes bacterium]|nr:MAG: S9 family peptidase [Bacteroidota bacterium]